MKDWMMIPGIVILLTLGGCIGNSNEEIYFRLYCSHAIGDNITGNVTIETNGIEVFNSTVEFRDWATIYEEKASGHPYLVVVTVNNITRQKSFLPDGKNDLDVSVTGKDVAFQGIID